jgi:hypothetical protein
MSRRARPYGRRARAATRPTVGLTPALRLVAPVLPPGEVGSSRNVGPCPLAAAPGGQGTGASGQLVRPHWTRSTIPPPAASMLLSSSHQPNGVPEIRSPPLVTPTAYGPSLQKPKKGPPESPLVASPWCSISMELSSAPSVSSTGMLDWSDGRLHGTVRGDPGRLAAQPARVSPDVGRAIVPGGSPGSFRKVRTGIPQPGIGGPSHHRLGGRGLVEA